MADRARRISKAAFFRDMGYSPHPGQAEIHACGLPRRVVACGVRWGKTVAAAMEGLAAAMAPAASSVGWIVAPTYDLADRVFRIVATTARERLAHRIVALRESDKRILLLNLAGGTGEIRAKSADSPVSLLGEGLDWLVVDEASRLPPSIWEGHLSQRLLDKAGWALLISTPRGRGWFYDQWRRGRPGGDPGYMSWNLPSRSSPLLDPEAIETERRRLPERVFRQEYGAEFVEGAGQVFRYARDCATGEWRTPAPRERYVAGLDLAKTEDYTALAVADRDCRIVHADRFHRLDWSVQIARIRAAAERYNGARIWVDTTGAGEPVYEAMRREGLAVEPYVFTQRSKAALIDNLAMMLESRRIVLPRADLWPEAVDEIEAYEYSATDRGHLRTGAPPGMHDDCVIAVALAAWGAARRAGGIAMV